MLPSLAQRVAAGRIPPGELEARVWGARLRRLAPSARVEVVREGAQRGQVTRLDLDPVEERYLLAAAGDGTVGLYDLAEGDGNYGPPPPQPQLPQQQQRQRAGVEGGGAGVVAPAPVRVRCLQATPRGNNNGGGGGGGGNGVGVGAVDGAGGMGGVGGLVMPRGPPAAALLGHGHVVTTVQWYPLDTGLFVSGSSDGTVRVWDTNAFVTAGVFDLGAKVGLNVKGMGDGEGQCCVVSAQTTHSTNHPLSNPHFPTGARRRHVPRHAHAQPGGGRHGRPPRPPLRPQVRRYVLCAYICVHYVP